MTLATPTMASNCGGASWYGGKFHNKHTASGVKFNKNGATIAHRTLPFGTQVLITNQKNGETVIATVTDRGPFIKGRIIDVSEALAIKLGFKNAGTTKVCIERV